jgi:hypothetical protein
VITAVEPVRGALDRRLDGRTGRVDEAARHRREDQREGRPAVGGDEGSVTGSRVVDHPDSRHLLGDGGEGLAELSPLAVHRLAGRQRDDRDGRVYLAAVAVRRQDLLGGLVPGLAGQREVKGEPVRGLGRGAAAGDQRYQPQAEHDATVPQHQTGQRAHD